MPGILYVIATPIGNLEDITLRALRLLKEADLVAAEDTRHSRKLFNHFGITTPLTSYFEHNELRKGEQLVEMLCRGKTLALISDAGTPGISDPGYHLVRRCHESGIKVVAVPGPSAVIAALSISGLPLEGFTFAGFLPAKGRARREALQAVGGERRTVVLYEAPHRLLATLRRLAGAYGPEREVAVARELTKIHEEFFRGTLGEALAHFAAKGVKGEIVLLLAPATAEGEAKPTETTAQALARWRQQAPELSRRELAKRVAKELGMGVSEVYNESLKIVRSEE